MSEPQRKLLQDLPVHTLLDIYERLEPMCPIAVVTKPHQFASEEETARLSWTAARRSVLDDIEAAIKNAKAKGRKKK